MGIVNFKTILDRTFMLLDQAISEKKEERAAQTFRGEYVYTTKKLLKKTANQANTKGEKI